MFWNRQIKNVDYLPCIYFLGIAKHQIPKYKSKSPLSAGINFIDSWEFL